MTGRSTDDRDPGLGAAEFSFVELDLTIVVPPGVMPITRVSDLLGSTVLTEVGQADRVLDFGAGCGINAILAARNSPQVVAVDIVPAAVTSIRSNAVRNRVADRLLALRSDGFDAVQGQFDVIILDATAADPPMLRTFFAGVDDHLAPRGRILIAIELIDDLSLFFELIDSGAFVRDIAAQRSINRGLRRVPYVVFRLTRGTDGGPAIEPADGPN